jgi:diguanylate cyclase (GGDEF)-like protein/putative nucleotidyltransferase with HDIG domain
MSHTPVPSTGAGPLAARGSAWADASFGPLLAGTRFYGTAAVMAAAATATVLILANGASASWLLLIVAAPLYLAYRMHVLSIARIETGRRHFEQLAELHLSTLEALALAIDAKDQTATSHIRRVQQYAAAVAEAMGMSPSDVQGVRTAALLHDIGKLAVPEHILSKPGPLSHEEFKKVQIHPQIGAEIIASVPFPYPVAPLILSHHEHWDGKGYPHGLKGEQIPLGARILSVVDQFDALTTTRPYHQAVSDIVGVTRIREQAGRALDPQVVETFVALLPELRAEMDREPVFSLGFSFARSQRPVGLTLSRDTPSEDTTVFKEIAQAHREIYALYEIAQSMGTGLGLPDTMTLIAAKLRNVVPFSACALFLHDEATAVFGCRFATGVDAELLRQVVLRDERSVIGWVGANRRPLVNARPSADFEAAGMLVTTALRSSLVCPLVVQDRLVGALAVYETVPGAFTDDHRRLLDRVSEQAAGVVSNAVVFEQTRHDSLTDPLTGLPNARFMFAHLTRELARAARLGSEVSVVVVDLDAFKPINDRFGHAAGDRALREVARALRGAIRPYDSCVRYAGDEFVIVLSGCGAAEAEIKRVELQRALEELHIEVRPGEQLPLGGSFGIASFPADGDTHEILLATADRRMYQDKAARKPGHATSARASREGRPSAPVC